MCGIWQPMHPFGMFALPALLILCAVAFICWNRHKFMSSDSRANASASDLTEEVQRLRREVEELRGERKRE